MSSLQNLQRVTYTNEMVMTLIELYKYHGKEFYYTNVLQKDSVYLKRNVIERETFFLVNFFNLKVTEHRLRLIIKSDSDPKTNDEKIVRNLKSIVALTCENYLHVEYTSNQVRTLVELLYKDIKRVTFEKNNGKEKYSLLNRNKNNSREEDLSDLLDTFTKLNIEGNNEITNLICNFYIDFINLKPFKEDNDLIGMILIYVFLFKNGFTHFKYVSFFELLFAKKEEFKKFTVEANYNWEEGFAKIEPLNNFIVKLLLENYSKMEELIKGYIFEASLNKSNDIENTILKGPDVFTIDDLRTKHPTTSDSTLNRALKRLKEEGKIKVLGTGRSAKWHKINFNHEGFDMNQSNDLFSSFNINED